MYFFVHKHYIIWYKASHQNANFWDFWLLESKFVKFLMSILKRQVNSSLDFSSFFSAIIHNSSVSFKFMFFSFGHSTLDKRISWKYKFWPFQVFSWKFVKFAYFPNDKSVFLQILRDSSILWKLTPLYSFRSNAIYFARKWPIKLTFFET